MSRFYDALREASRSQPAQGQEQDWGAVEKPGEVPAGPPFSADPGIAEAVAAIPFAPDFTPPADALDGHLAAEPGVTPEELLQALLPQDGTTPVNGSIGSLATIAFDERARLLPHAVDSVVVEYYRRLRTKILQQHATQAFRTVVITSGGPQEGKTLTTLNLALSFAMLPSFKVLVVDGDLRRGTVGKWLGLDKSRPGLTDLIEGAASLADVVLRAENTPAHFMLSGNSKTPPAELLSSPRMAREFRRLSEYFDLILVDSAPLNLVTDAQLLAAHCDAVLLVARAFYTTRKSLEKAVEDLKSFRIIGTVLNGASRAQAYRRYHGYYHDRNARN